MALTTAQLERLDELERLFYRQRLRAGDLAEFGRMLAAPPHPLYAVELAEAIPLVGLELELAAAELRQACDDLPAGALAVLWKRLA